MNTPWDDEINRLEWKAVEGISKKDSALLERIRDRADGYRRGWHAHKEHVRTQQQSSGLVDRKKEK